MISSCGSDPDDAAPYLEHENVLGDDLADWLEEVAQARNLTTLGVIRVRFEADASMRPGRFDIDARVAGRRNCDRSVCRSGTDRAIRNLGEAGIWSGRICRDLQRTQHWCGLSDSETAQYGGSRSQQRSGHREPGGISVPRGTANACGCNDDHRPKQHEWNLCQWYAGSLARRFLIPAIRSSLAPRSADIGAICYDRKSLGRRLTEWIFPATRSIRSCAYSLRYRSWASSSWLFE